MKRILLLLLMAAYPCAAAAGQTKTKGVLLEDLTWLEAEKVLTREAVVVIPLGAAAKEHGPHLKLKNDWLMAEYLKRRVLEQSSVVVAPTINYHYYPAFLEYPGSTSPRVETARDLVVDVCRGLARYGPRRFYALNTGVSTLRALQPAAEALAKEGITLRYTDLIRLTEPVVKQVSKQEGGTHADEVETSMMLYIAPSTVDMKKAAKDYHPSNERGLTRDPKGRGVYSATGNYGDATLATRAKGERITKARLAGVLREIEELRQAPAAEQPRPSKFMSRAARSLFFFGVHLCVLGPALSLAPDARGLTLTLGLAAPVRAQRRPAPRPKTVRDFFNLLPRRYFTLEGCTPGRDKNCDRARAEYLKTYLEVEDTANGYMKGGCDGAQSCFQLALFKRPDGTYLVGLTTAHEESEQSYFLEYAGGAWRDLGARVVPEYGADKVYELPRDGTTVAVYANEKVRGEGYRQRGRKLYDLVWKGGRFTINR